MNQLMQNHSNEIDFVIGNIRPAIQRVVPRDCAASGAVEILIELRNDVIAKIRSSGNLWAGNIRSNYRLRSNAPGEYAGLALKNTHIDYIIFTRALNNFCLKTDSIISQIVFDRRIQCHRYIFTYPR